MLIEFLNANGSSPTEIHRRLRSEFGEDTTDVSLDVGSVVLGQVKRILVAHPATTEQLRQRQGRYLVGGILGLSCHNHLTATCADIKEVKKTNSNGLAKQEDHSDPPPA
jgi:hypothetical protein